MSLPDRRRAAREGFSLIEIMIAVVIIGIMAGTVTVSINYYLNRAKRNRAKNDVAGFINALEAYYTENGRYPSNDEGLGALAPKFVSKVVKDPWNNDYQYNAPGVAGPYDIVSFGADKSEGGGGADADITNVDLDVQEKKKES